MSVLNDKKVSELEAVYLFSYLSCAMTLDKLLMRQHTYAYWLTYALRGSPIPFRCRGTSIFPLSSILELVLN